MHLEVAAEIVGVQVDRGGQVFARDVFPVVLTQIPTRR
jgi:hypothetical protein